MKPSFGAAERERRRQMGLAHQDERPWRVERVAPPSAVTPPKTRRLDGWIESVVGGVLAAAIGAAGMLWLIWFYRGAP